MGIKERAKRLCSLVKEIVGPGGRRWLREPDAVHAISQEIRAAQREVVEKCLDYIKLDWFDSEGMLIAVDVQSFLDDMRSTFIEESKP